MAEQEGWPEATLSAYYAQLWPAQRALGVEGPTEDVNIGPTDMQKWAASYLKLAGYSVAPADGAQLGALASQVRPLVSEQVMQDFIATPVDQHIMPDAEKIYGIHIVLSCDVQGQVQCNDSKDAASTAGSKRTRQAAQSNRISFTTHFAYEMGVNIPTEAGRKPCAVVAKAHTVTITLLFGTTSSVGLEDTDCDYKPIIEEGKYIIRESRADCTFVNQCGLVLMTVLLDAPP